MPPSRPFHELRAEGAAALNRGDLDRARAALFEALLHTSTREEDYVAATALLADVLSRKGEARGALTLAWYAAPEAEQKKLLGKAPPLDRARTLLAWADSADGARKKDLYTRAADEYEAAGSVAQAAIAREKADDALRARALWSRLSQVLASTSSDYYAAGLAHFNLARTSLRTGDKQAARGAMVAAVHLVQEAADRYETIGQRERAFDCFQVLLAIGRETGELEHALEGAVNVVRILREDHLRYYALQSYEEGVRMAEERRELSAAATLAREMAAYARKEGLPAVASWAKLAEARLWQDVAAKSIERKAPPELAENALLASVMAFGECGQYAKVGAVYQELAALPLEPARSKHYARARGRYSSVQNAPIDASPLPAHLRHEAAFPEVWHVDLVEWEQQGSAAEACADVLLDEQGASEATRRRAMVARLIALEWEDATKKGATRERKAGRDLVQLGSSLAEQLGTVELYTILSPLAHLFRREEPEIRVAVVRALGKFLYKRTFITLREAVVDRSRAVVEESARSIEELRFVHAFDPLARIYRESAEPIVRTAAIRSLAKIDKAEAAEVLLQVLQQANAEERAAAVEALRKSRGSAFIELGRKAMPELLPAAQQAVREVFQARGVSL